jgi:hypothetical protein
MARRGDALREHILWVAKEVFLELGFERASMDDVGSRALSLTINVKAVRKAVAELLATLPSGGSAESSNTRRSNR